MSMSASARVAALMVCSDASTAYGDESPPRPRALHLEPVGRRVGYIGDAKEPVQMEDEFVAGNRFRHGRVPT